eukprot:TRINITY_DN1476_c0_g1_i2.p1 TRINITY_DN1476_c0_g1~~TRINITY_DN1476_c0_g1_i2.p1  ORF type:complete len:424 (-),score=42.90 TRINITY_DN1476_c0_g1_i2:318-1541(-)
MAHRMEPVLDTQGVFRGACNKCSCPQYQRGPTGSSCNICSCKPIFHREVIQEVVKCKLPGCHKAAFMEQGKTSEYCSRGHSQEASRISPAPICQLPGCRAQCFLDSNGTYSQFCTRKHRDSYRPNQFQDNLRFPSVPTEPIQPTLQHGWQGSTPQIRRQVCLWIDCSESAVFEQHIKESLGLESQEITSTDPSISAKKDVRIAIQKESESSADFNQKWKTHFPNIPLITLFRDHPPDQDALYAQLQQEITSKKSSPDRIEFYNANEPYYEFTNFFDAPFSLDGKRWPTSEHYFQAHKFEDRRMQENVRSCFTPRDAFNMARRSDHYKRFDWESVKDEVMHRAVMAKFSQNAVLEKLLLSTGDAYLVEHTANDRYWGDGGDGSGKKQTRVHLDGNQKRTWHIIATVAN